MMDDNSTQSYQNRIILLLDLDCFYAQCETVRLGLNRSMPLCLLQWNSALAVNYPARALGLKRGASFETIQQMSGGTCIALHLPVISAETTSAEIDNDISVEAAYQREYNLPQSLQKEIFAKEKNQMRKASEGKASLERYRLASTRIFQVILQALENQVGKNNFILERASIDELFIDVTTYCYSTILESQNKKQITVNDEAVRDCKNDMDTIMKETFVYAKSKMIEMEDENDQEEYQALRRGCLIAHGIRKCVLDTLGFTMSAGISTTKLVAKLGASYGKPNGQAVIFSCAIPYLMDETKIRKVRNLGGKIGKEVQKLLPPKEDTMGSVSKLLSLDDLCQALGMQTGKMVFHLCRGIDEEPVRETKKVLVKSITAFKSFSTTTEDYTKWISILATDVMNRILVDKERNNRYPTTCVIQYYYNDTVSLERKGASMRIPLPLKACDLVNSVQDALEKKVPTTLKINRLGLSAVGFEDRPNGIGSITSFFSKQNQSTTTTNNTTTIKIKKDTSKQSKGTLNFFYDGSKQTQPMLKDEHNIRSSIVQKVKSFQPTNRTRNDVDDTKDTSNIAEKDVKEYEEVNGVPNHNISKTDLALAQKLQKSYDRENYVLKQAARSKRSKIDHFFKSNK